MTTIEVLKAARELLSDPARWTKGAYARDAAGEPAGFRCGGNALDDDAVCFCSLGAVHKACGRIDDLTVATSILTRAAGMPVHVFNDGIGRTHDEILRVFDQAIEIAEKEAQP